MIFADRPYFLSGGGISYQSGKVVCVDKGDWDKPVTSEELDAFNLRWLTAVREHMKDNATIWISGTHHNIFSVQQQLLKLGFKVLNIITRPLQNLTPSSIILVFEHYWLTRSQYFWFLGCICSISSHILPLFERIRHNYPWSSI